MDLETLSKEMKTEVVAGETKSPEILQLEALKRNLIRLKFKAASSEFEEKKPVLG